MKFPLKTILTPLILSVAILTTPACSKKDPGPSPEEIAASEEAARIEAEAEAAAAAAEAEAAAEALAIAEAEAEAAEKARLAAIAIAMAEAEAAAEAEALAIAEAEARALAEAEAAALAAALAQEQAEAEALAIAEAEAKAKAEAEAQASMKRLANDLYQQHNKQFDAFKDDCRALSNTIDANAGVVTVAVADRLLEMRDLMPGLIDAFDDLEDYQGDDLEESVSEIKAKFDRAETLYAETMALLPEEIRPVE